MQFDSNTPRTARTIAGREVQVIQPFAEGYVLNPALAAMLNQTLAENFSNNLRKKIEAGKLNEAGEKIADYEDDEVQTIVDEYMAEYEPGVRRTGDAAPRVTDPVEREGRKIARAKVLEKVKGAGLKAKDVDMDALTDQLYGKYEDTFRKEGAKVVKALEAARKNSDDLEMDFDLSTTPAETEEVAA